jgi:hypothetical protein
MVFHYNSSTGNSIRSNERAFKGSNPMYIDLAAMNSSPTSPNKRASEDLNGGEGGDKRGTRNIFRRVFASNK